MIWKDNEKTIDILKNVIDFSLSQKMKEKQERKICNAIMRFEGTNFFCMCELEEDHTGFHQGLNWSWEGMDITVPDEIRQKNIKDIKDLLLKKEEK